MGTFDIQKMLMCTLFWGEGSQKVYGLYTYENVDMYGRPLNLSDKSMFYAHWFTDMTMAELLGTQIVLYFS